MGVEQTLSFIEGRPGSKGLFKIRTLLFVHPKNPLIQVYEYYYKIDKGERVGLVTINYGEKGKYTGEVKLLMPGYQPSEIIWPDRNMVRWDSCIPKVLWFYW